MMTTGFANHATYTSGAAVTAMIEIRTCHTETAHELCWEATPESDT
jgi:hypothetical protein